MKFEDREVKGPDPVEALRRFLEHRLLPKHEAALLCSREGGKVVLGGVSEDLRIEI
jgi:hypothetical protein